MNKINILKAAGVTVSALLLIGATGCNQQTASPAIDVNTAPETTITTAPEEVTTPVLGTQVLINDTGFEPQKVTVKVGESVTWTNNTTGTVRVASDPHPLHTALAGFDDISGATLGDTYTFIFTKKGTFGYHNHNDSKVKGTVVVTE